MRRNGQGYGELEVGEEALDHLRCPLLVRRTERTHFTVAKIDERVLPDCGVLDLDGDLLSRFEVPMVHLC